MNKLIIGLLTVLLCMPAYAAIERIQDFSEDSLPILNENFRRLEDSTFQVKSSSSDTTPSWLDGQILDITVVGTVSSGTISGWTITSDKLTGGSGESYIALIPGTGIQMGNETFGSAEFSVTNAGALKATSGTIGGWTLSNTALTSANSKVILNDDTELITVGDLGGTYIKIDGANSLIESSDYTSGVTGSGFRISAGLIEAQNIAARGIIRTAVFEKGVVSVIGGSLLVMPGDVLDTDMTALDASNLAIEGNETFSVGDMLRIKDGTDDEWFEVTGVGSAPTYAVTRDKNGDYGADSNPAWKAGASVVNYQASGDGGILLTSSDSNSPHIDIFSHAGSPWTTTTTHMRMGNLNGFLGYAADLYGIAIGEATKYLTYDPTNGLQIKGIIVAETGSIMAEMDGYTTLLIHCDGGDGRTSYTAETGQVVTFAGTSQLDTAQKKFGTSSLLLDGNSDFVTVPDSADWIFGTGDFTIDLWVRFSSLATHQCICSHWEDATNFFYFQYSYTAGSLRFNFYDDGSSRGDFYTGDLSLAINTWYHVALVKSGSTPYVFIDGVSKSLTQATAFGTLPNLAAAFAFGNYNNGGAGANHFNGYMDEIRISNIARWTANFNVPLNTYMSDTTVIDGANIYTGTVTADKITTGSLSTADIDMTVAGGTGDCHIRAGIAAGEFTNASANSGFILGIDDSDSDKAKLYMGDATNNLTWNGVNLQVNGQDLVTQISAAAGEVLNVWANDEYSGAPGYPVKLYEIYVAKGGVYKIKFDLDGTGSDGYGRIYLNASPVGIERGPGSGAYVTYTEDITVSAGDAVQLYGGTKGGGSVKLRNFGLYTTENPSSPYVTLNANVAVTDF